MLEINEGQSQLPPDSSGARVRTLTVLDQLSDGTLVLKHMQVIVPTDKHGKPLALGRLESVLENVLDVLNDIKDLLERQEGI